MVKCFERKKNEVVKNGTEKGKGIATVSNVHLDVDRL